MNNYSEDCHKPTQEEQQEIEDLILQEEFEEIKNNNIQRAKEINMFSLWCKKNGIIW